jgi:PAS domain S-box-containing protein
MDWEPILYIIILSIGIVVSLAIARYAWQRRSIAGVEYFVLYSLAAVLWALGTILTVVSKTPPLQTLWGMVGGMGIVVMPVAWLGFTLKYTGREKWLATRTWMLIAIAPIILLLLSGGYDTYRVSQVWGVTIGALNSLMVAIRWVSNLYVSALLLVSTLLIILELIRAPRVYRGQYLSLLVGVSTPWFFGVLLLWGLEFFPPQFLFIAFVIGELVIAWGIFRHQVFEIMPIALDQVIESISDGVIVLDIQHRIVDLNPAAQRMTGLSAQQVTGLPIAQALPAWKDHLSYLDHEETQTEITLGGPILRSRSPERSEGEAESGRGACCYQLRISPLHNRRQALSGWLILLRDITDRKRAEEALAEERTLLRTMIDNLPDYIFVKDTESQFVISNMAHVHHLGATTQDEVVGKTDFDIFPQELAAQYYADEQEVIQSGQPLVAREEYTIDPEGRKQWLLTTKVPLCDSHGKIVGLVGISRDITEHHRAQTGGGGIARGQGSRRLCKEDSRSRQPGQEHLSGQYEPRVTYAPERDPGLQPVDGSRSGHQRRPEREPGDHCSQRGALAGLDQ